MGAIPFSYEEDEKKNFILTKIKKTNNLKSPDFSLPLIEVNHSNTKDSIPKPEEPKAPAPASPPQIKSFAPIGL